MIVAMFVVMNDMDVVEDVDDVDVCVVEQFLVVHVGSQVKTFIWTKVLGASMYKGDTAKKMPQCLCKLD